MSADTGSGGELLGRFARAAARAPQKPAVLAGTHLGGGIDYGTLIDRALRLATRLGERGVGRGDRVAVRLGSRPELAVVYLAILARGAAMLPIHLAYRRREIAHLLVDAEPRLVVGEREELDVLEELAETERGGASIEALEALLEGIDAEEPVAPEPVGPEDLALLIYTSGTTGASKGAELSHGAVGAMIDSLHEAWRWSADDRLLLTLPLFHVHGLVNGLHCALAAGATLLLEPRFDAERVLDRLGAGEATLFFGVPTIYVRLVEALRARGDAVDLSSVRLFVSGSAPLPAETWEAFRELTGHAILERYGMTETGMLVGNPYQGPRRPGTVGRPFPGVELRVVDADGAPVADGEEGEVEVRGPTLFSGYRNAPEKTASSFRNDEEGRRWFRTGDLGRLDPADGYLSLLGRSSELILSGGFNVYPREIEEVLLRAPGVREAAVVGEPHPEFGESPLAYLVTDGPIDEVALDAWCRDELAAFKRPRRYARVDALPRNALGKVEKRRLRPAGGGID